MAKMESLIVLNVFCTASEGATTSTSQFIKIPIFIISDFFSQKIFNLMIQIWRGVLRDKFLVFGMCLETSYLFPKIFLPGYFYDLFTTHYFF